MLSNISCYVKIRETHSSTNEVRREKEVGNTDGHMSHSDWFGVAAHSCEDELPVVFSECQKIGDVFF
jgi:hypothetical protein